METSADENGRAKGACTTKTESGELDVLGRRSLAETFGLEHETDRDIATTLSGILLNLSTLLIIKGSEINCCKRTAVIEDIGVISKDGAHVGGDVAIGVVIATSVTGVGKVVVKGTDEHSLGKNNQITMDRIDKS